MLSYDFAWWWWRERGNRLRMKRGCDMVWLDVAWSLEVEKGRGGKE